jgi:hypothetical protein
VRAPRKSTLTPIFPVAPDRLRKFLLLLIAVVLNITQNARAGDIERPRNNEPLGCEAKLENFVTELDALLDSRPQVDRPLPDEPFQILLNNYFPLKHCDAHAAVEIIRRSKYLIRVDETWKEYGFAFVGGRLVIGFEILKETGDSYLPFAKVMK